MPENIDLPDAVFSLAASPDFEQDGICFAACQSGLYRSEDSGRTWQPAYQSLDLASSLATFSVAVSPAFLKDRSVFAGVSGAILYSKDSGWQWRVSNLRTPPPLVSSLALSPNYAWDGVLFAGTMEDGILRSGDGGRRWEAWNFGLLDLSVLCLGISPDFGNDQIVYAGTDSGIFRSTNGGRAWRELASTVAFSPITSLAISPMFTNDGTLFAGTEEHGLYCSRDRGLSWTRLGGDKLANSINGIFLGHDTSGAIEIGVLVGSKVLASIDGGQSWRRFPTFVKGAVFTCGLAPQGFGLQAPLLLGLADGRILRSEKGGVKSIQVYPQKRTNRINEQSLKL